MRGLIGVLFCSAAFAMGSKIPNPEPSDEQYVIKGLSAKKQETKYWCTISSAQMMLSQFKKYPSQCELASAYHRQDCCNKMSVACSREATIEGALPAFGYRALTSSPSFDKVWNLIKQGRTVAIYHYNRQGSEDYTGHSVVAYWAYKNNGKKYIVVYDPLSDSKKYWNDTYVTGNLAWYRLVWIN